MRLHFTAAEASGDLLAHETIEAIRERRPGCKFAGIGGAELARSGIRSPFDIAPLSILGLVEGLKAYRTVIRLADAAADHIISTDPDAAILVDSWGFMIRVADRLRARAPHIRLIKLVGPQVWAMRPGRAKKLAARVDHVLCLHEMERPFYEPHDVRVTVIGNPALSRAEPGDGAGFRARHGFDADAPLLLVLPGSRPSEIRAVAPVLMQAARRLKSENDSLQVIVAPAEGMLELFRQSVPDAQDWSTISARSGERFDVMAAADLALACSGTVTSELAMQDTPMLVGYRVGAVTWAIARHLLYKPAHITIMNIAADDTEIVPEFVQSRLRADLIAATAQDLLNDGKRRQEQVTRQRAALKSMGEGDRRAPDLAAEAIISDLE
ncbi:MAG: lipid-A-disaccharide synthase [Alphaproteobacteria bacterium]|jgi:lipid-A-disaccharide synthase|nr:lipid-A-disaccharide synthase [Alphaproteobacteria bacterium]